MLARDIACRRLSSFCVVFPSRAEQTRNKKWIMTRLQRSRVYPALATEVFITGFERQPLDRPEDARLTAEYRLQNRPVSPVPGRRDVGSLANGCVLLRGLTRRWKPIFLTRSGSAYCRLCATWWRVERVL